MNAQSRILADPIGTFLPGCVDPEEVKLRTRLLTARELATSRIPLLQSEHARTLNWILLETVQAWVYGPASVDELRDVANHCLRLFMCSTFAEAAQGGEA